MIKDIGKKYKLMMKKSVKKNIKKDKAKAMVMPQYLYNITKQINIYIISNWYCNNITTNILISYLNIIVISNYNYCKSNNINIDYKVLIFSIYSLIIMYSIILFNIIYIYFNLLLIYYEYLCEYISIYIIIIFSIKYLLLLVLISELLIIIIVFIVFNYHSIMNGNGIIDGIILNDSIYIVISINVVISMISNFIIYIWLGSNICNMIINYIIVDIGILFGLLIFIELQCKEYNNYNSYMNEIINISILFIMLGIHLLHIIICYFIILVLYIYSIIINYSSILYILYIYYSMYINIIFSILYYHIVSLLYFIINIVVL